MSSDLSERFERAIENDSMASDLDRIETRACTTDDYDGVQYNIYGRFIPVRPVIDAVAEVDGHGIEQLHHTNDGDHICLGVFVADLPEQPHPAFVN